MSFDLYQPADFVSGTVSVQVLVDGVVVGTYSAADTTYDEWVSFTVSELNLTAGAHTVSFVTILSDGGEASVVYLDNVSVVLPVPEPSSIAMLLGGLGLLGAAAYRRRSA